MRVLRLKEGGRGRGGSNRSCSRSRLLWDGLRLSLNRFGRGWWLGSPLIGHTTRGRSSAVPFLVIVIVSILWSLRDIGTSKAMTIFLFL
jgi:hypothetical protein